MSLTERQKVAHLLRRFGFGASVHEMEIYAPLGAEKAMDRLLDFDGATDWGHPLQYVFHKDKEAELGSYRFKLHWINQMVVTDHPLRERLALFWHDHFAVVNDDVGSDLAVMFYIDELRRKPGAKFGEVLNKMAKSVAIMRQLNVNFFSRMQLNENFAREILELYTLGEGHYTEKDIKAVAQAMSGWGHLDVFYFLGKTNDERIRNMVASQTPAQLFIVAPAAHIPGDKMVVGKPVENGEDVVQMLAQHPQTARHLCGKLWEWFAGPRPSKAIIDRLAKRWQATDGDIKEVLREMSRMDEFYADSVVRKLVKNPLQYMVSICRAQNLGAVMKKTFPVNPKYDEPISEEVISVGGGINYWASESGMDILYPTNGVAGWDWHEGWISTNTLLRRRAFTGARTWYEVKNADGKGNSRWDPHDNVLYIVEEMRKRQPANPEAMAQIFCALYDCALSAEQSEILAKHFEKAGGLKAFESPDRRHIAWTCTTALNVLGSTPEFQLH